MRALGALLVVGAVVAATLAACGDTGVPISIFGDVDASLPVDSGQGPSFPDASGGPGGNPGGGNPGGGDSGTLLNALTVEPADAVLAMELPGNAATQTFTARLKSTGQPAPNVTFFLETPAYGSFASGRFTASGAVAGLTRVYAQSGNLYGSTGLTVRLKVTETDPGVTLTDAERLALRTGGNAEPAFRFLYPYDKTVWPRGLPSPTLQFTPFVLGAEPRFRLTVKSKNFEYEGFYGGAPPAARLPMTDALWKALTSGAGAQDPVTVTVTKRDGAGVTGPRTETWDVAEGSLKGVVHYNTYKSPAAQDRGVVMRIRVGSRTPELVTTDVADQSQCTVCHQVSANGNVLMAARGFYETTSTRPSGAENTFVWDLLPNGTKQIRRQEPKGRFTFGGLTPDGAMVLTAGVSAPLVVGVDGGYVSGDPFDLQLRATDQPGPTYSRLFDTRSGDALPGDGGPSPTGLTNVVAYMPAFSPDGRRVAFVDYDKAGVNTGTGRTLTVMDFNLATRTFSNPRSTTEAAGLSSDPGAGLNRMGWPAFTADGKRVVYHVAHRFTTHGPCLPPGTDPPPRSNYGVLKEWDVDANVVRTLHALNGADSNGASVLPWENTTVSVSTHREECTRNWTGTFPEARMNYEPTLLPVPVGGYHWVVFASRRSYGNFITPNTDPDAFQDPYDTSTATGRRKKMWIAPIDLTPTPGQDTSHPAIYLEGQELESGNLRAYWSLDPCRATGASCESGADCCGGFCRPSAGSDGGLAFTCVPKPQDCSQEFEGCTADGECCDNATRGVRCIGGRCARPQPPR